MNFTNTDLKEAERKRILKNQLNNKTRIKTQKEQTKIYWILTWIRHPINSFKRWLVLTFPKQFNLGE